VRELRQERALLAVGLQHDLKTPITSILGAAGLLAEHDGNLSAGERIELLEMIQRQGHRMKDMIAAKLSVDANDDDRMCVQDVDGREAK
jgi:K+-sensing histidine kinase KdpD